MFPVNPVRYNNKKTLFFLYFFFDFFLESAWREYEYSCLDGWITLSCGNFLLLRFYYFRPMPVFFVNMQITEGLFNKMS